MKMIVREVWFGSFLLLLLITKEDARSWFKRCGYCIH